MQKIRKMNKRKKKEGKKKDRIKIFLRTNKIFPNLLL